MNPQERFIGKNENLYQFSLNSAYLFFGTFLLSCLFAVNSNPNLANNIAFISFIPGLISLGSVLNLAKRELSQERSILLRRVNPALIN